MVICLQGCGLLEDQETLIKWICFVSIGCLTCPEGLKLMISNSFVSSGVSNMSSHNVAQETLNVGVELLFV